MITGRRDVRNTRVIENLIRRFHHRALARRLCRAGRVGAVAYRDDSGDIQVGSVNRRSMPVIDYPLREFRIKRSARGQELLVRENHQGIRIIRRASNARSGQPRSYSKEKLPPGGMPQSARKRRSVADCEVSITHAACKPGRLDGRQERSRVLILTHSQRVLGIPKRDRHNYGSPINRNPMLSGCSIIPPPP